jgi:hypothetical protein
MSAESRPCNLENFANALSAALGRERGGRGIGTLGEKTLHAVLKSYFEPNEAYHEIKAGGFVADIVSDSGVIEIQTRSFDRLRKKLGKFLELVPVTVVCPVVREKQIVWLDPESGEASERRKSPKTGKYPDALREICKIHSFLGHENLTLCILLLDVEEYRLRDGYANGGKRGSTRYERIPTALIEELYLKEKSDYAALIPPALPKSFTAADFRRAVRFGGMSASFALKLLCELGLCEKVGQRGRAYVYERKD